MQDLTKITYQPPVPGQTMSPSMIEADSSEAGIQNVIGILRRRWLVLSLVSLSVFTFQLSKALKAPPVYEAQFQLLIQRPEQDITNPLEGAAILSQGRGSDDDYYNTQMTILLGNKLLNPVLQKIYQKYPYLNKHTFGYDEFLRQLSISRPEKGQILTVRYIDSDPQRVEFVLQSLAKAFLDYTKEDQDLKTQEKLKFVNQQIPLLQRQVITLQDRLLRLKEKYEFYNPEDQGQFYGNDLNITSQKKREVTLQIQQIESMINILEIKLNTTENKALALDTLAQSPQYLQLISKLNEINLELAKQSNRLTDDNVVVQQLKADRESILRLLDQYSSSLPKSVQDNISKPDLLTTAPNAVRTSLTAKLLDAKIQLKELQAQQQYLILTEANARNNLKKFTHIVNRYLNIERQLQLSAESLNRLSASKQALEVESAKRFVPWRLVSVIEPPEAPQNNLPKDILQAILMGLLAGGAVAMLVENLDRTYHNPEDLARDFDKTLLGVIPFEGKLKAIAQKHKDTIKINKTNLLEAFSILYSNLFFLGQKQTCRSFIITSATSGDGKSTISFFLALAAAKLGQRVLLIDGDRYFPQGKIWKQLAESFNADLDFPEVQSEDSRLQQYNFEVLANNLLYFKTKDDAMEPKQLMSSTSLFTLIQQWQASFDIILIDTPPILGISDAKLIASKTDGVLLVVRLEQTIKDSIRLALHELNLGNLNLLGLVANGAKRYGSGYYYNNYYYSNRYYSPKKRLKQMEES
jgi:capsular exopolysaccharide synthesis family protein